MVDRLKTTQAMRVCVDLSNEADGEKAAYWADRAIKYHEALQKDAGRRAYQAEVVRQQNEREERRKHPVQADPPRWVR